MMTSLHRQTDLFRSNLSVIDLLAMMLEPVVVVLALMLSAYANEGYVDAPLVLLALIAFSLTFPGTPRWRDTTRRVVREVVINWLTLAALLLFFGYASGYLHRFDDETLRIWFFSAPAAIIVCHELGKVVARRSLSSEANRRRAVIIGMTEGGTRLARQFRENPYLSVEVMGFFDDREPARLGLAAERERMLGRVAELAAYVQNQRVDQIYITLPMATQPRIMGLLDSMKDTTASIFFVPDIFVTDLIQGRMENIGGMPVVAVCESPFTGVNGLIKRASDVLLSLLILVLISPLLAVIAAGVKAGSAGPVLFKQRRYGADGQEIIVYKFRSMTVCEDGERITQATRNDQRITPFGGFLRKTSLDELPQFINVIQGRMSIVGPRPHAVAHNELYRKLIKGYMVRHKVKPGITGWAQVNGFRGETETVDKMQKRIEYDLEYLRTWSLGLDLWIIVKTVLVVANDRHAY